MATTGKKHFAWIPSKDTADAWELKCEKCGNRLMRVFHEPMEKQRKTVTANHTRVSAQCPFCGGKQRVKSGAPD
jgi:competence CoiA-like predicted nuclease